MNRISFNLNSELADRAKFGKKRETKIAVTVAIMTLMPDFFDIVFCRQQALDPDSHAQ